MVLIFVIHFDIHVNIHTGESRYLEVHRTVAKFRDIRNSTKGE
jgi:hypothetical protein